MLPAAECLACGMLLLLLSALLGCWLLQSVAKMWRSCSAWDGVGGVGGGAYGSGLTSPAWPLDPFTSIFCK